MDLKKIIDALDIENLTADYEYKENLLHVNGLKVIAHMADLDASDGEIIVYGASIDVADAYIELGRMKMANGLAVIAVSFPMNWLKVVVDINTNTGGIVNVSLMQLPATKVERIVTKTYEITRPADTLDYAAGDVIADSTSAPALPYFQLSDAGGIGMMLTHLRAQTNNALWAGVVLRLHFYTDVITAIADNVAFSMLYANAAKRIGYIDLTFDAANGGSTNSVEGINNFDKLIAQLATGKLYVMPEIRGVKTPVSGQKIMLFVTAVISE